MTQSFANPLVEQREFLAGKSAILLEEKVVFTISGEDRLTWLNDLFSQKLDDLLLGVSVEALWLDAQGHIVRDFHIIDDGVTTWLTTYKTGFEELLTQLKRMVFRAKVAITDCSADYLVVATWDKDIQAAALQWADPWPEITSGGYRYGQASAEPWLYRESLVPVNELPAIWNQFGKAGTMVIDALRVASHRPAGPNEIEEKSLPHEYDWLTTAVHLSKGCYRGQEAVAKIHNLGHPPRRLALLHLDGSGHALPEIGDEVYQEEKHVGKITSVGQHYEMGPIALAVLKRNTPLELVLTVHCLNGGEKLSAHQEEIVPSSAGAVVDLGEFRAKRGKES
jgi:folate-binding protein YgfZ